MCGWYSIKGVKGFSFEVQIYFIIEHKYFNYRDNDNKLQ